MSPEHYSPPLIQSVGKTKKKKRKKKPSSLLTGFDGDFLGQENHPSLASDLHTFNSFHQPQDKSLGMFSTHVVAAAAVKGTQKF